MEKLTSEQLLEIRDNPNVQKFMDIIGTLESGNRYNVITGGETFDDDSKHPDKFGVKTADGVSDAAGRYQFLNTTFQGIVDQNPQAEITDFSPEAQDKAFILLLEGEGVLDDVMQGGQGHTRAIENLGKQFTSLPSSTKFYKQGGAKTYAYLNEKFGVPFPRPPATPGVSKPSKEEILNTDMTIVQQPFMDPAQQPSSYDIAAALTYLSDTQTNAETNFLNAMMGMPTTGATKSAFDPLTKFLKESAQGDTALDVMVEEQEPRNRAEGSPPEGEVKRTPGAFIGPSEEVSPAMATVRNFFEFVGDAISPKGGSYDYFGNYIPPTATDLARKKELANLPLSQEEKRLLENRGMYAEELLGIRGMDGDKGIIELFDDAAYGIPITSKRGEDKPFGAPYAIRPKYRQAVADAALLGLDAATLGYNPLKGAGIVAREGADQLGDLAKYGYGKLEKDFSGEERLFREGSLGDVALSQVRPSFMFQPFEKKAMDRGIPSYQDPTDLPEVAQPFVQQQIELANQNKAKMQELKDLEAVVKGEPNSDEKIKKLNNIKEQKQEIKNSKPDPRKIIHIQNAIEKTHRDTGVYNPNVTGVDPYYLSLLGRTKAGVASLQDQTPLDASLKKTVNKDIFEGLELLQENPKTFFGGFNLPIKGGDVEYGGVFTFLSYRFFPEEKVDFLPSIFSRAPNKSGNSISDSTLKNIEKIQRRANEPYKFIVSENDLRYGRDDFSEGDLKLFLAFDTNEDYSYSNPKIDGFLVDPVKLSQHLKEFSYDKDTPLTDVLHADLGTSGEFVKELIKIPKSEFFLRQRYDIKGGDTFKDRKDHVVLEELDDYSAKLGKDFVEDQERMFSRLFLGQVANNRQSKTEAPLDYRQKIAVPFDFNPENTEEVQGLIRAYGIKNLPKGDIEAYEKDVNKILPILQNSLQDIKNNFSRYVKSDNPSYVAGDSIDVRKKYVPPEKQKPLSQIEQSKVITDAIELGLKRAVVQNAQKDLSYLGITSLFSHSVPDVRAATPTIKNALPISYEAPYTVRKSGMGYTFEGMLPKEGVINKDNYPKAIKKPSDFEDYGSLILDKIRTLGFSGPRSTIGYSSSEAGKPWPRDPDYPDSRGFQMGLSIESVSPYEKTLPTSIVDIINNPKELPGYQYQAYEELFQKEIGQYDTRPRPGYMERTLSLFDSISADKMKDKDLYTLQSLLDDVEHTSKSATNKIQKLVGSMGGPGRQRVIDKKLSPENRMLDTELYLKVDDPALNLSEDTKSGWYEDTTKQGMKLRGEILNHCIKDPDKKYLNACLDVNPQEMRIFHYFNDKGHPILTYALDIREPGGLPIDGDPKNVRWTKELYGYDDIRVRKLAKEQEELYTTTGKFNDDISLPLLKDDSDLGVRSLTFKEVKEKIIAPLEKQIEKDGFKFEDRTPKASDMLETDD